MSNRSTSRPQVNSEANPQTNPADLFQHKSGLDMSIGKLIQITSGAIAMTENPEQKNKFSERIIGEAAVLEQILEVENKFLPPEHNITTYLNERIAYFFPNEGLTVKVAVNEDEPNALSLPNGTIIVSKGLLKLLDTREELDFILAHEGMHYVEGHVQEINDALKKAKGRFQKGNSRKTSAGDELRILGALRMSEYEADIKGAMRVAKEKINPAAARSVFLKFQKYEKKRGRNGTSDVSHGSNIDRIVNIGIVTQLIDYEATSQEEKPLPGEIKAFADTGVRSMAL